MRRMAQVFLKGLPILLAMTLVAHFGSIAIYLTPLNPAKLLVNGYISRYVHPFFEQNWHLFAPDPVNDTRVLTVSCRVRRDDGSVEETNWFDATSPLRKGRQENRLGPADRLDRLHSSAVHSIFNRDETLEMLIKHRREDGSKYNQLVDELIAAADKEREDGVMVLNRIGSAHCGHIYGGDRIVAVHVRIAVLRFPRYSERDLPDSAGELSYTLLPWAPYTQVAPFLNRGSST